MNKKLKKALVALAIAPSMMLSAVGCFDKDNKEDNKTTTPTELSATQKNEAYLSLKTLSSQKKLIDTTSTASSVGMNMKMSADVDLSKSGLTEAGKTALATMGLVEGETVYGNMDMKAEVGYMSDNTGYMRATMGSSGDIPGGDYGKTVETEITKVTGTGDSAVYTTYTKSDVYQWAQNAETEAMEWQEVAEAQEKSASLVDSAYVPNTYKELFDSEDMEEMLGPTLEFLSNYDSYTDLVNNVDDFANEMLSEYSRMDSGIAVPEGTTATADLTLTDGVYELKAIIDINDLDVPADELMGTPASKADMDLNMSIKFDSDSINAIDMDIDMVQKASMSTYDTLSQMEVLEYLESEGITVTDDDTKTISSNTAMSMGISVNTGETFDTTIMSTDTTGYTGEGEEGAIVNRKPTITYVYGGNLDCELNNFSDTAWGETYGEITASDLGLMDGTTIKLYSDEAMTQEITATSTIPSYDHNVYVKVTPAEGYACVVITNYNTEDDYGYANLYFHDITETFDLNNFIEDYMNVSSVVMDGQVVTEYDELTLESKIYNITINLTYIYS